MDDGQWWNLLFESYVAKQVTRYFIILFQKPYKEAITMNTNIYPRTNDLQTVYLNAVINNPHIKVGDYTIYNDFVTDPVQFEKNNVLSVSYTHLTLPTN